MGKYAQAEWAKAAASFIKKQSNIRPLLGIILGSGLGDFVDTIENRKSIPYNKIPYFVNTTIKGHAGRLVIGKIGDFPVAVMQGRFYDYKRPYKFNGNKPGSKSTSKWIYRHRI